MYYRYFKTYDSLSDYNNDSHGRTPQVVIVNEDESVHYQEIQYRTITAATDSWTYQKEYENICFYRDTSQVVNKYQGFSLPFDYIITEQDLSDGIIIAGIANISDAGNGSFQTANLSVGNMIIHNKPYLFKTPKSAFVLYGHRNKCYNLSDFSEPAVVYESSSGSGTLFNFYTNYSPFTCPEANKYYTMMKNGTFNWLSAGSVMHPYRWYWVKTTPASLQSTSNSSNGLLMGGMGNPNNTIFAGDDDNNEF